MVSAHVLYVDRRESERGGCREESPVKCSRKLNVRRGWRDSSCIRKRIEDLLISGAISGSQSGAGRHESGWWGFCYVEVTLLDEWMVVVGAKLNDVICGGFNFLVEQLLTMHETNRTHGRGSSRNTQGSVTEGRHKW